MYFYARSCDVKTHENVHVFGYISMDPIKGNLCGTDARNVDIMMSSSISLIRKNICVDSHEICIKLFMCFHAGMKSIYLGEEKTMKDRLGQRVVRE